MVELMKGCGLKVLEPTPGTGQLSRIITANGHTVYSPDGDFWLMDHSIKYEYCVMNPPFTPMSEGYRYLRSAMDLTDNIIALLPWFIIINSEIRLNNIMSWGLISVTSIPRKTFPGTRIQCCILEMKKGFSGTTDFKTFTW